MAEATDVNATCLSASPTREARPCPAWLLPARPFAGRVSARLLLPRALLVD